MDVQHLGCKCLRNLAVNADNQELITKENGHGAIVEAMNAHKMEEVVQVTNMFTQMMQ